MDVISSCGSVHAGAREQLDVGSDAEMCLVVTDIENSTRLSVVNPYACAASQDKHDAIMMDVIQQCHGTELLREGDSFRVAFKQVAHAVQFCLQVTLLHHSGSYFLRRFIFSPLVPSVQRVASTLGTG